MQMFYFFFAYKQVYKDFKEVVISVPSGNFGNICAGLMAQKIGLPIKHFIASTNVNDTVPQFLATGSYQPKPSKPTISNAMDVGNPSNFIRIQELFDYDINSLKKTFSSYSFTDNATKDIMKKIHSDLNYVADPHGATGFLGLQEYGIHKNEMGIFFETAHPVKFLDTVEDTLKIKLDIPPQIEKVLGEKKTSIKISNYNELKDFLNH